jgi:predicted nucleic acid-binding protein
MTTYLLDTNILLRGSDRDSPFHNLAENAVAKLLEQKHQVCLTSQTIVEFWAVATRPVEVNGLGWSVERTCQEVDQLLNQFPLLEETSQIFGQWLNHLTLPSLKAWGFSLLRESLESTELNPDTFPDLKTAQRAFFGIAHPYLEVIRSRGFLKEGA